MAHIRKSGLLGGHNVASGSASYTFPSLPPEGRLLVARFSSWKSNGGAGAFSVVANQGPAWTVNQYSFADIGINNRRIGIAYLRVPAGLSGSYTVTISTALPTSSLSATISEYSEMAESGDPLDQIARAYGFLTNSLTVTSGTTSQATELVCTALDLEYWEDTDANVTVPSGYTMRDFNDDWNAGPVFGSADKEVSATGAQAPVWTFDSAILLIGIIATFKKAVTTTTPTNEITGGGSITFGDIYSPIVSYSSSPPSTASTGTTHTITAAAIDDLGISSFVLKKDGVTVASSSISTVSYSWTLTTESGSVQWRAVAVDTAGNETTAFATTAISNDTTVPTVTLSASDSLVEAASEHVTLTAIATDNTGIASVKFYRGNPGSGTLLSTVTTPPYRHVVSFTRADNGSQPFYAVASDAAGNVTNSTVVTIAVSIPDVYSLTIVGDSARFGAVGDEFSFTVRVLLNGAAVSGASVVADSSDANVFVWYAPSGFVGLSLASGGDVTYLTLQDGSGNQTILGLSSESNVTDSNGEIVFTGYIVATAAAGDSSTLTFTSNGASVTGSVTVGAAGWVTVVRNSNVWVQVQRDVLND